MKKLLEIFLNAISLPAVPASEEERRSRLLAILLWVFAILDFILLLLFGIFSIFGPLDGTEAVLMVFGAGLFLIIDLVLIFTNRSISSLTRSILFVVLVFSVCLMDSGEQISTGRSLIYFALPIVLSGLLIRPWAGFVTAILSCFTITVYAYHADVYPDYSAMVVYIILAIIIWMATFNLERYINKLAMVYAELLEAKDRLQERFLDTDAELQQTKERLDELVMRGPAMIYSSALFDGYATTFMSRNVNAVIGYSPSDFTKDADFWLNHIHPDDRPAVVQKITELISQGKIVTEYRFQHADGSYRWMRDEERLVRDENGTPLDVVGSWIDITKEKEARLALQASENRYRALAEAGKDIIFIVDRDNRFEYVNRNLASALNVSAEQLIGMDTANFFPEPIAERHKANQEMVFQTGDALLVEEVNKFPMGERWMSTWLVPMKNEADQVISVLGVARDITRLKSIEKELLDTNNLLEKRVAARTVKLLDSHDKLRLLASAIIHTQEDERRRVSRELHDEAGQSLVGLKMRIDQLFSEIPGDQVEIRKKISKVSEELSTTMRDIRALAHGLRPTALDVAGLNVALSGLCQELSEQSHLNIFYDGFELPRLPDEISITLYRFVQEALTNIIKHASASTIHVHPYVSPTSIEVVVSDDGLGFDPAAVGTATGLHYMEERLGLLDGRLDIVTLPGQGTTLHAFIPYAVQSSESD